MVRKNARVLIRMFGTILDGPLVIVLWLNSEDIEGTAAVMYSNQLWQYDKKFTVRIKCDIHFMKLN